MTRLRHSATALFLWALACGFLLTLCACSPTLPVKPTLPAPPPALTKPLRPLPAPPTVQALLHGSWTWPKSTPNAATA